MATVKCPNCGKDVPAYGTVCPHCWANVGQTFNADNEKPASKKSYGGKIALALCALVIIGIILGGKQTKSRYETSQTASAPKSSYVTSTQPKTTNVSTATMGEKNALLSAQNYLRAGLGFSKKGLENQLDYEGYTQSEISYAISHCGADWKQQAEISAKNYLRSGIGFSRSGLIDQLIYEGYTLEEAEHGAEKNGY